jgi:nicotinamidase-related amidase
MNIMTNSVFEIFRPDNSALLLIDHQIGTMQLIRTQPLAHVKQLTIALAKAAAVLRIPVVLTSSQETLFQGPLLPELKEILPEAYEKRVKRAGIVDAWTDPNFVRAVKATGRRNLIMAGVTTDVCLIFPAINAVKDGCNVQAVLDASGSPYELSEYTSRNRMERAGVVLTATNTMIAELVQDWSTPEGEKLKEILFREVLPPLQ